ncbi:MAG: M56 family metallopeptidase [Terriglobales bacterium]
MTQAALLNHLWQSTWFALAAGAVAWALRHHQARVRFWVWMAASLKFLLPFSAFAALGRLLPAVTAASSAPVAARFAAKILIAGNRPFSGAYSLETWTAPDSAPAHVRFNIFLALWIAGSLALAARWLWRARRLAAAAPGTIEPGVLGIFRQRLVLPPDLAARLAPAELAAVLARERCHMRRHDNLWSALHMVVEIVFWFHPFVWIIGARLMAERERACDEAVLEGAGGDRAAYASAILQVCRRYVAAPAACAAGISGGSLTQRVRRILAGARARARRLSRAERAALIAAALALIGGPILLLAGQQTAALAHFEAAVIKPAPPGHLGSSRFSSDPLHLTATGTLERLIEHSYHLLPYQVEGPSWLRAQRFTINAVSATPVASRERKNAMLRALLAERFQLKTHFTTKRVSGYALEVVPGLVKLQPPRKGEMYHSEKPGQAPKAVGPGDSYINSEIGKDGLVHFSAYCTLADLAGDLSRGLRAPVVDRTGLKGGYFINLIFLPLLPSLQRVSRPSASAATGPKLFDALEQQLGLKLVPGKEAVRVLVVDSALRNPTAS